MMTVGCMSMGDDEEKGVGVDVIDSDWMSGA